jgi:hypothetical protein
LARRLRFGVRLPAVGHDVAELVTELIGKFRPVAFADVAGEEQNAALTRAVIVSC